VGDPLIFYFDRRRQGYDQAARIRSRRWFGVDVGDRELYLWGSPIEVKHADGVKRLRDALFNHRLLNAFNMSPQRMDEYLKAWDRFRPTCLFGYPSSIALLVEHARSRGRKLGTRSLRAVFVTGEVCYPHQRETIASYFGVPVADGYGSREAGFIAHECPEGSMHLTAENVIVEIVDSDGNLVPGGQSGEIVVTHLDAYAMPFIRYRTGDVGRLKPGRCACGRGLSVMDVVQGRATDFLYLPDGNIRHALSIIYPLREMAGVRQFRVTQQEDYSVTVDVVADDNGERITREAVAQRIRSVVGDQVDLRVALVERIASTNSGKYRYVISHARPAAGDSLEEVNIGV
ncbi:MAG: AMP-binding protein, partial [Phycisphaerae bacterium]